MDAQQPVLSGKVLVVDDMPDGRRFLAKLLERAGVDVDTAEDGQEAVEKAIQASRVAHPFDLVLMDMQMPVMDGFTATALMRSNNFEGKIVALTGMGDARDRCKAAGCDDFILKPIGMEKLVQVLAGSVPPRLACA